MNKLWTSLLWLLMVGLALAIAGYAAALLVDSPLRSSFVRELLEQRPVAAVAHFGGSALALAMGGFQLNAWVRRRSLAVHRWMGRLYVIGVAAGGLSGLFLGWHAHGGLIAKLGFVGLAIAWLATTTQAYTSIRGGDFPAHRAWMIRSFALTYAAVTLRLYIPASQAAGIPFELAYPVIAWACWVPNLLVAELLVRGLAAPRRMATA